MSTARCNRDALAADLLGTPAPDTTGQADGAGTQTVQDRIAAGERELCKVRDECAHWLMVSGQSTAMHDVAASTAELQRLRDEADQASAAHENSSATSAQAACSDCTASLTSPAGRRAQPLPRRTVHGFRRPCDQPT